MSIEEEFYNFARECLRAGLTPGQVVEKLREAWEVELDEMRERQMDAFRSMTKEPNT